MAISVDIRTDTHDGRLPQSYALQFLDGDSDSESGAPSTASWSTASDAEGEDDNRVGAWHYAVAAGSASSRIGRLTRGHAGALVKEFAAHTDSERFLNVRGVYESLAEDADWYYAVAVGRRPGVYTHFRHAQADTRGFSCSRTQMIERFWQAEAFLSRFGMALMARCSVEDERGRRCWIARQQPRRDTNPRSPGALVAFCYANVLRNGGAAPCAAATSLGRSWRLHSPATELSCWLPSWHSSSQRAGEAQDAVRVHAQPAAYVHHAALGVDVEGQRMADGRRRARQKPGRHPVARRSAVSAGCAVAPRALAASRGADLGGALECRGRERRDAPQGRSSQRVGRWYWSNDTAARTVLTDTHTTHPSIAGFWRA